MIYLLLGIVASSIHVLSGPDHLAAVTPIAIENRKNTWRIGCIWGFGHTMGVFLLGLLFIVFKEIIPTEKISHFSEQLVGLSLIVIGSWILIRIYSKKHHHELKKGKSNGAAFTIGALHGLAGISHIIGILPSLALPTMFDTVIFISGFSLGTILTMSLYTYILGFLSHSSFTRKRVKLLFAIRFVGSLSAILVGIFWFFSSLA